MLDCHQDWRIIFGHSTILSILNNALIFLITLEINYHQLKYHPNFVRKSHYYAGTCCTHIHLLPTNPSNFGVNEKIYKI